MSIFRITEEQLKYYTEARDLLNEYGSVWGLNDNGDVTLSVDSDPNIDNNSNPKMKIDTRVFGQKDDILNYKPNKLSKSLSDYAHSKESAMKTYQKLIKWVENGRRGVFKPVTGTDAITVKAIEKRIPSMTDEELIASVQKDMERIRMDYDLYTNKYNRVSKSKEKEGIMRYNVFTIPNTNVKCIALFTMSDFNFSDAIKHGTIRANHTTDTITGNNTDSQLSQKLDVRYDNGVIPDIAQNFSLKDVGYGHFKQQYPNGGYTSINQFLDKSIVYAAKILKDNNYIPDFIVGAPSSSKFNHYFCTNLANKLGSEYLQDFFQRNVTNIRLADGTDASSLKSKGFSDKEVMEFISSIKKIAYQEINYIVCKPVTDFVTKYKEVFGSIYFSAPSEKKRGRSKKNNISLTLNNVITTLCDVFFKQALKQIGKSEYAEYITQNIIVNDAYNKKTPLNYEGIFDQIINHMTAQKGISNITNDYMQAYNLFLQNLQFYIEKLSKGYKPKYVEKAFKITKLDKRFRNYIEGVYIIADKYMYNDNLQKQYRNAKFLIYDEDVNSGATLRLVIDALNEKVPYGEKQILCMANAYSSSGR